MVVRLPADYPFSAPAMNIAPGTGFNYEYHSRVWDDPEYGGSICVDILAGYHGYFKDPPGWTPSYTLSTALMQMQVFFSDPDLPVSSLPSKSKVAQLKTKLQQYVYKHPLKKGGEFVHSTEKPNPPINLDFIKMITQPTQETKENLESNTNSSEEKKLDDIKKESPDSREQRELREKLSCTILKHSLLDSTNEDIFGYPLLANQDKFKRIHVTPSAELISRTAYSQAIDQNAPRSLYSQKAKTGLGNEYNFWVPMYINKEHFKLSKDDILRTLQAMMTGSFKKDLSGFDVRRGADILFGVLNKTIVSLLKGTWLQSIATIEAYCQYYLLLVNLIKLYPEILEDINKQVKNMLASDKNRSKQNLGDMGEFVIKLAVSDYGIFDKSINLTLLQEYFARQVFWVLKEEPGVSKVNSSGKKAWLGKYFEKSKVSNQLLAFNMAAANVFLNKEMMKELEENYGFPQKDTLEKFMKQIEWIRKEMKNYNEFFSFIGLVEEFSDEDKVLDFIKKAFGLSVSQKYTQVPLVIN